MTHASISFIGAGRLGTALARALHRQGEPVMHVASRSQTAAHALAQQLGAKAVLPCVAAQADLVFLTVTDDAIQEVIERLPWRAGQSVVHCSGATEICALRAAAQAGAHVGGFHPLQIFSDPERAIDLLAGSYVAIEATAPLQTELHRLAHVLGMHPIRLPPGARPLYHGSASYAASFLLSMLAEAVTAWRSFGIEEHDALQALLPLARGTLDAAQSNGLAMAVAGPISRGDAGVIKRHLAAMQTLGSTHAQLYKQMTQRQLELVQTRGRLSHEQAARVRQALDSSAMDLE